MTFASADDRTWAGVGLGGSYNWSDDRYSLHGEAVARTSLAELGDSYSFGGTVGLRVKW
ncbi:autotransporter [Chelativorans sp. M5D2P16]|uniref:autotransporter n=1 Tax=Chelativorans sp. M5D2P16 TaxID=3095678 RepID=UPI003A103333